MRTRGLRVAEQVGVQMHLGAFDARPAHGFGDGGAPARRPAITSEPNGPAQARANRRQFSGGCASVDDLRRGSSPERDLLTYGPSQLGLQAHLLRGGSREGHTVTSHEDAPIPSTPSDPWARTGHEPCHDADARARHTQQHVLQPVSRKASGIRRIGRQQAKHYNHLFFGSHLYTSSAYAEHNFRRGCSEDS